MKAVLPVTVSNGILYLQMRSVGSHRTFGREEEGKKEGTGELKGSREIDVAARTDLFCIGASV